MNLKFYSNILDYKMKLSTIYQEPAMHISWENGREI